MIAVSLWCGWGEGDDLGSLVSFPKPHSPGIRDVVQFEFCLAGLVLLAQATRFSLSWLWRGCSRNYATFWGDTLLAWDQRKWDLWERGWSGSAGEGPLCSAPTPQENWGRETKHTQRLQPSCFISCGEEIDARDSPDFHRLPKLLCQAPVCSFVLETDTGAIFHHVAWDSIFFFPWNFWVFFWCAWAGGVRFNIWQFNI